MGMNPQDPPVDPEALLRAAAAALPGHDAAALAALGQEFPELSIEAVIGRGGSGVVYRVRQTKLGRLAALKILEPGLAARDAAFGERLQREAQLLAQLDHPGILKVYDFGERGGRFYLLCEFVEGIDLRKLMAMGELAPSEALRLVPQICAALQYAHDRGVVHRDVKPENILIDLDGNAKLADFGLARLVRAEGPGSHLTRDSQLLGTPHYMAPEQWRGAAVDHRADIFALGVVFYELLTGHLPVGDFAPPSQRSGVPARLDQIVRKALAQDPGLRFQRAAELGQETSLVAAADSRTATGPTAIPRAPESSAAGVGEARSVEMQARPGAPSAGGRILVVMALLFLPGLIVSLWWNQSSLEAKRAAAATAAEQLREQIWDRHGFNLPIQTSLSSPPCGGFLLLGLLIVVLVMILRSGFRSIRRIQRAGAGTDGLVFAELRAWGIFVGAFDAAVLVPILQIGGRYQGAWFASVLLVLVPLNVVFFVWRYRCDRAAIGTM